MSEHQPQLTPPPMCPLRENPLTEQRVTAIGERHVARQPAANVLQCVADFKYGVGLNHLPSGHFGANAAWLALNVIAHNLARQTARIGGID
ncbi:MAG: hypothetical protein M0Z30_00525, partial [Actinomycetota bacterium]|nr:hypothetical protein [Actinomycetota bacterium]